MKPLPIDDLQGLRSLGSVLLKGYHHFEGEAGTKAEPARTRVEIAAEQQAAGAPKHGEPAAPAPVVEQPEARQRLAGDRAFSLWRAFDSRLNALEGDPQEISQRRPLLELTTALFPVGGGVGATTITATVAQLLAEQGRRVLVVDGDADPMLAVYLGDMPSYGRGVLSADGLGRQGTVHVLAREQEDADGTWLQRGWQRMEGRCDQALIDVWPGTASETLALAGRAGRILLLLTPDLGSILRLPRVLEGIRKAAPESGQKTPYLLLNKFDAALGLHRDVRQRLSDRFGEQLLPFEIRRSDEPAEAFAAGTTVVEFAAQSGITMDMLSLAQWISVPMEGLEIDEETGLSR